jgi:hypothetical protein
MKVNEIPKKIYLSYETDDEDDKEHIFIDYMWHRHPFESKNLENVEYIRTDAFIEKSWDWIEDNLLSSNQQDKSRFYCEQFKNYLKK